MSLGVSRGDGIEAFTVDRAGGGMRISCTIGPHPRFSRLVIRFQTDGSTPSMPSDGRPLLDTPAFAGATYQGRHHPLNRGFIYAYKAFGLDGRGSIRASATARAWPATR